MLLVSFLSRNSINSVELCCIKICVAFCCVLVFRFIYIIFIYESFNKYFCISIRWWKNSLLTILQVPMNSFKYFNNFQVKIMDIVSDIYLKHQFFCPPRKASKFSIFKDRPNLGRSSWTNLFIAYTGFSTKQCSEYRRF